jgi:hypothetical protein
MGKLVEYVIQRCGSCETALAGPVPVNPPLVVATAAAVMEASTQDPVAMEALFPQNPTTSHMTTGQTPLLLAVMGGLVPHLVRPLGKVSGRTGNTFQAVVINVWKRSYLENSPIQLSRTLVLILKSTMTFLLKPLEPMSRSSSLHSQAPPLIKFSWTTLALRIILLLPQSKSTLSPLFLVEGILIPFTSITTS